MPAVFDISAGQGVRIFRGLTSANLVATGGGGGGEETDQYGQNVSLLTHFDQDSFLTDSSLNNFTVTAFGNVSPSTSVKKFGSGAAYFDGNGDYLSADSSGFAPGYSEMTVEMWVRFSSLPSANNLYGLCNTDISLTEASNSNWWFGLNNENGTNFLRFGRHGDGNLWAKAAWTPSVDLWYHVAVVKQISGNILLFVDGNSLLVTQSNSTGWANNNFSGSKFSLGVVATPAFFHGYIDDLRITKGIARYTANFTPPTAAFPNPTAPTDPYGSNVSLLLHADGAEDSPVFTDSSLNNLSITAIGNARVKTGTKKFGSGAAYFDGNGDYLTVPNSQAFNFGTGDFTLEAWIYITSLNANNGIFGTPQGGLAFAVNNNNRLFADHANVGGSPVFGTTPLSANTWYHVAVSRSNGIARTFINGVIESSGSWNANFTSSSLSIIGNLETLNTWPFNGYIDDLRITKGVARYTSNFTPPTSPFPNPTVPTDPYAANVSLLLHADGANNSTVFTDSSSNDLTLTAFNGALVGTSVKKFGTGALSLNGGFVRTNDNVLPSLANINWTVEFWVYPQTIANTPYCLINLAQAGNYFGLNIYYNQTGGEGIVANNAQSGDGCNGGTLVANTWQHVAVVMNNGTKTIYLNGTSVATGTQQALPGPYAVFIGNLRNIGWNSDWLFDDVRITRGIARYTSNFTPPTSAFPNP